MEPVGWLQKGDESSSKCLHTVFVVLQSVWVRRKSGNPKEQEGGCVSTPAPPSLSSFYSIVRKVASVRID